MKILLFFLYPVLIFNSSVICVAIPWQDEKVCLLTYNTNEPKDTAKKARNHYGEVAGSLKLTNSKKTNLSELSSPFILEDSTKKNAVKFTPLKVVGIINPGLEISYERRFKNNYSGQLMGSYLLPYTYNTYGEKIISNAKGFRLAIEGKSYLPNQEHKRRYLALELDYMNKWYNSIEYFERELPVMDSLTFSNYESYADSIKIRRQMVSLNLKFGYQFSAKRIVIDFYFGLGFRYRYVTHFDRINPTDKSKEDDHYSFKDILNKEGGSFVISVPLNLRIGWTF